MQKLVKVPETVFSEFCREIDLPEEMRTLTETCNRTWEYKFDAELSRDFFDEEKWDTAMTGVQEILGEDPDGVKILTLELQCAVRAHAYYQNMGISEEIYRETYKCFSRFVREHKVSYGRYGFDRHGWAKRQIAMKIFRIGELEYQLPVPGEEPEIGLHIPSDAKLTRENIRDSVQLARTFLKHFYEPYAQLPMSCCTWLLSEPLSKILPEGSHILQFQELFCVKKMYPKELAFMEWLYQNRDYTLEDVDRLPERTSLQRLVKKHLKDGGVIGEGYGILQEDRLM